VELTGVEAGSISIALYQGPSYPRADYTRDVSALLAFHRERFVGRDRELEFVADHVAKEQPGYLLVEAPGGFGKSTMLAQLVDRISGGQWPAPIPALACYFVRADGARNTAAAFLAAVNAQLLGLLGLAGGTPPAIAELRTQFSQLWSAAAQRATAARPVLLVVDGLDEMEDEDVSIADVLPAGLGPHVHVVVSSRARPDARERVDRVHPLRTAAAMSLPAFGLQGIELMLGRYAVAAGDGVAERILGITHGEPLFARFVCEELGQRGVAELDRLEADPPRDAEDYFREQLRRLDEAELGDVSWQILGTLVVARGGMTDAELAAAMDQPTRVLRSALRPLERFLLGGERRDIFHRRLRELIAGEFSAAELTAFAQGLIDWCASYGERGWPEDTPAYVLDHYADHLAQADWAALIALSDQAWMTRRREAAGSLGGFIADAEMALGAADTTAAEVRLCLILASARSVATSAPADAIGVLAQLGHVTEARSYIELIQGELRRAAALRELGAGLYALGDPAGGHEAFVAAVEQLERMEFMHGEIVEAIEALAGAMADTGDTVALTALVPVAESLTYDHERAASIAATATALSRAGTTAVTRSEAVRTARLSVEAAVAGLRGAREVNAGTVGSLAAAAGALGLTRLLEELSERADDDVDLAGVAEGWARLGEERRALDVTARIAGDVADAVPHLKAECFDAVRREMAREALAGLPEPTGFPYGFALAAAARAAAAAGDPDTLVAAIDAVTGDTFDESVFVEVAAGWAGMQHGADAVATLGRMPVGDGSYVNAAGPRIAATLAAAGLFDDALAVAAMAVEPAARAAGIAAVARGRLDAGDRTGALAEARRALSEGETLGEDSEPGALATLAGAFARAGDAARAAEAIDRAHAALLRILPGGRTARDVGPVFAALMTLGWLDEARTLADGAYPDAGQLGALAHAHALRGDVDIARELVPRVIEMAVRDSFGTAPVELLFGAAQTLTVLGDDAVAGDCIDRALAFENPTFAAEVELLKIKGLADAGRGDVAASRARALAEAPGTHPAIVAHALANAGCRDEAVPYAREAIVTDSPFPDPDGGLSYRRALATMFDDAQAADFLRALRPGITSQPDPWWRTRQLAALADPLYPLDPESAVSMVREAMLAGRLAGRWVLLDLIANAVDAVGELAPLADVYEWILEIGGWWAVENQPPGVR
jgi:hypothetical protein